MDARGILHANPAELQQYGQHLYRNGQYEKAIEIFGQALRNQSTGCGGVLDNRVAAYLKLSQLDLALRDAKQMLKTDQQDERGYLRAAQILLLKNRTDKALEMYAYGLKTIRKDHPKRHLLQSLHNKLNLKMGARYRDPFHSLPLEIAHMVLQYFDFRQIVGILRVCKKWERFLSSVQWIWLQMDLSVTRRGQIGYPAIRAYINRSKAMLTHVVLSNIPVSIVDKVLVLLGRCPKLTHLDLRMPCDGERLLDLFRNSKNLKGLITRSDVGMSKALFASFLSELPNLENFESHRPAFSSLNKALWPHQLPKLKRLSLTYDSKEHFHGLRKLHIPYHDCPPLSGSKGQQSRLKLLFESLPSLQDLTLRCIHSHLRFTSSYTVDLEELCYPQLRRIDLEGLILRGTLDLLPESLEYMRVTNCRVTIVAHVNNQTHDPEHTDQAHPNGQESTDGGSSDKQPIRSLPYFPNLSTLILDNVASFNFDYLPAILERSEKLVKLELSYCHGILGTLLAEFAESGKELKHVSTLRLGSDTGGVPDIEDAIVERLVMQMPVLRNLSVPYSRVTGVLIKDLVDARRFPVIQEVKTNDDINAVDNEPPEMETQFDGENSVRKERQSLPHVENLYIKGCELVSFEAIEFGRKNGLTIVYQ